MGRILLLLAAKEKVVRGVRFPSRVVLDVAVVFTQAPCWGDYNAVHIFRMDSLRLQWVSRWVRERCSK